MTKYCPSLSTKTYPLDYDILPHVADARDYYEKEYEAVKGPRKSSMMKSLKYYGFLSRWYHGAEIEMLSKEADVSRTTMSSMLMTTEKRIKMYIKLKDQGAL